MNKKMMCGGLGDTKPADENIHAMVKNVFLFYFLSFNLNDII